MEKWFVLLRWAMDCVDVMLLDGRLAVEIVCCDDFPGFGDAWWWRDCK
jgi:hypothetical protein